MDFRHDLDFRLDKRESPDQDAAQTEVRVSIVAQTSVPSLAVDLELQIVASANVAVVRCRGRLIYGPEVAELGRTLRQLLVTTKQIVLQMAEVTQIDSAGVGALGAAFMAAHNRGGTIRLAALSPRVSEVLRITGLERLFEVHASESDAIETFLRPSRDVVVF